MAETKAKRSLKNIDFSKEGAHVALCSAENGPANNHKYSMLMKATSQDFTEEFVKKIQSVQVEMEFPDFLQRFFGMWCEDAEILARLLGYVEPVDDTEDPTDWYENYILDKLKSFTVLKAANEAASPDMVLANLSQEQYLQLVKDQSFVEKAFRKHERILKKAKTAEASSKAPPEPTEIVKMTQVTVDVTDVASVQKSLDDVKVQLEKASAEIAAYKKEKQEAIVKSKTDRIASVVKEADKAVVLTKAALALEADEDFNSFVSALEAIYKQVETSALFKEQGKSVTGEDKEKQSGVAAILKAQYTK